MDMKSINEAIEQVVKGKDLYDISSCFDRSNLGTFLLNGFVWKVVVESCYHQQIYVDTTGR